MKRSRKFLVGSLIGIGALSLLVLLLNIIFLDVVVEVLWYQSLGYLDLMIRKVGLKYLVFAVVSALFFLVFFLQLTQL